MAIDYVIDLDCFPKRALTSAGLLARIKSRNRADAIIKLYRDHNDNRPPSEMGFEMVRRTPDGNEETQIVMVNDLLDDAAPLDSLSTHCAGCPANRTGASFGCYGFVGYPISRTAELWLLKQLPGPDDPLVLLLLRQTLIDYVFRSEEIVRMRQLPGTIFETSERFARRIEDVQINTDQVFEMLFLPTLIQPAHGVLLMLFFGAIPRDMDAESLMRLTRPADNGSVTRDAPFLLQPDPADDESIIALKGFFEALHVAYRLNVSVSLDA
jgi:hypothetical protein